MADVFGLVLLAAMTLIASLFVPSVQVPSIAWAFIYPIVSAAALFVWHHPKAPKQPMKWLLLSLYSLIAAPLCFGFLALCARIFFTIEPENSRLFDLAMTLIISPGFTIVAILGWLRELIALRITGLRPKEKHEGNV